MDSNPESSLSCCFGKSQNDDSSLITSKEIAMNSQIGNNTSIISLDELKWNIKRLLREIHPKGILLHDLEEIYYHWFHKNVSPDMFHVAVRGLVPDAGSAVHSCIGWNWTRVFNDQPSLHQTFVLKAVDNDVYKLNLRPGSFTPEETKLVMAATEYSMCKLLMNRSLLVQQDKSCGTDTFQVDKSCGVNITQADKNCGTVGVIQHDKSFGTDVLQQDKSCGTDLLQVDKSCETDKYQADLPQLTDASTQYSHLQLQTKDTGTETDSKTLCEAQVQTSAFLIKIPTLTKPTVVCQGDPGDDTNERVELNNDNVNVNNLATDLDETLPIEIPINTLPLPPDVNVNIAHFGNNNRFINQETELQDQIVGENNIPLGEESKNTSTSKDDGRNNDEQLDLPVDTIETDTVPVASSTLIASSPEGEGADKIQSLGHNDKEVEAINVSPPDVVSFLQRDNLSLKLTSPDDCNKNLQNEIPFESRAQSLRKMISSRRECEKTHKCTYNGCKNSFDTLELRQKHVIQVHLLKGLKHKCTVEGCKNVFSKEEDLLRHIALCSMALSRKRLLDSESNSKSKPSKSTENNSSHGRNQKRKDSDIEIIEILPSSSPKRFKVSIDEKASKSKDYYSIKDTIRKDGKERGSGRSGSYGYDESHSRSSYRDRHNNNSRRQKTPTAYVSPIYQSRSHSLSRSHHSNSRSQRSSSRNH